MSAPRLMPWYTVPEPARSGPTHVATAADDSRPAVSKTAEANAMAAARAKERAAKEKALNNKDVKVWSCAGG